jgi:hypothetical protein
MNDLPPAFRRWDEPVDYGAQRIRYSNVVHVAVTRNLTFDEARRLCFAQWLARNGRLTDHDRGDTGRRCARRVGEG